MKYFLSAFLLFFSYCNLENRDASLPVNPELENLKSQLHGTWESPHIGLTKELSKGTDQYIFKEDGFYNFIYLAENGVKKFSGGNHYEIQKEGDEFFFLKENYIALEDQPFNWIKYRIELNNENLIMTHLEFKEVRVFKRLTDPK